VVSREAVYAQHDDQGVDDSGRLRAIRPDVMPAVDMELLTFLRRSVTAR
jgi:hypothetical protein